MTLRRRIDLVYRGTVHEDVRTDVAGAERMALRAMSRLGFELLKRDGAPDAPLNRAVDRVLKEARELALRTLARQSARELAFKEVTKKE